MLTRADYYERLRADLDCPSRCSRPTSGKPILLAGRTRRSPKDCRRRSTFVPRSSARCWSSTTSCGGSARSIDDFDRLLTDELEPRALDRPRGRTDAAADRLSRRRASGSTSGVSRNGIRSTSTACARGCSRRRRSPATRTSSSPSANRPRSGGLWPVDFDLLTRLHGMERLDGGGHRGAACRRLATNECTISCRESRRSGPQTPMNCSTIASSGRRPQRAALLREPRPRRGRSPTSCGASRRVRARSPDGAPRLDRTGVVFARPLPYLYLARDDAWLRRRAVSV